MKKWFFGGLCLLILFSGLVFAQERMVIIFKDGKTQSIDINTILKIEYQTTQPTSSTSQIIDNFSKGIDLLWDTFGVVGGNFQRFARVEPGRLTVRVPEGNSWGKTGIFSKKPFITIDETPVCIQIELDEKETTGVCIALSAVKDYDI